MQLFKSALIHCFIVSTINIFSIEPTLDKTIEYTDSLLYPTKETLKYYRPFTPLFPTYNDFKDEISKFITQNKRQAAQAITVNPGSKIYFVGDLHADLHSLTAMLKSLKSTNQRDDNYKLINKDTFLVFLGDYVDRGWYDEQVLHILLKLKNANPKRVFLLRGNHEDITYQLEHMSTEQPESKFIPREDKKIGHAINIFQIKRDDDNYLKNISNLLTELNNLYEHLSLVLYIGIKGPNKTTNFVQCNHGGIDLAYNPTNLLSKAVQNTNILQTEKIQEDNNFILNGVDANQYIMVKKDPFYRFCWGDFKPSDLILQYTGRLYSYNQPILEQYFEKISTNDNKIVGLIRGHQHDLTSQTEQGQIKPENEQGYDRKWISNKLPLGLTTIVSSNLFKNPVLSNKDIFTFCLLIPQTNLKDWNLQCFTGIPKPTKNFESFYQEINANSTKNISKRIAEDIIEDIDEDSDNEHSNKTQSPKKLKLN
ncbi:MAG: hypothetical protein UR26_C0004G0049 [candidate division TM6 bacterium GW2011_GWF2_32_72]|nr:MAG: hypothetical protein UR26_C0004G0049 [candidate division TM6 bacterium GW2011_GWF2_32_72]